jgi:hypothetical protein
MKVKDAKVCLDCDEVYAGSSCTGCGSTSSVDLKNWLAPLPTKAELEAEKKRVGIMRRADELLLEAKDMIGWNGDEEPIGAC